MSEYIKNDIFFIYFDTNALQYIGYEAIGSISFSAPTEKTGYDLGADVRDYSNLYNNLSLGDKSGVRFVVQNDSAIALSTGENDLFKIKLKVKDNKTGDYSITCFVSDRDRAQQHIQEAWFLATATPSIIRIGDSSGQDTVYTVAATTVATDVQANGSPFNVDVTLTADPTTSAYAQAYAELTYDDDFVIPKLDGLNNVSGGDGKLIITGGSGGNVEVGENGAVLATIPFTPIAEGSAAFTVSEGATVTLKNGGGAEIDAASGEALTVEISAAALTFTYDDGYAGLPSGHTLLMYELGAKPGVVWTYEGKAMHYVYKDSKHYVTYIVTDEVAQGTPSAPVPGAEEYAVTADVTGNGAVSIGDSQIAYDLSDTDNSYYDDIDTLGIAARLAADVNNDGEITTADAEAIIYAIHHNGALPAA